jgi:hypothetical protein
VLVRVRRAKPYVCIDCDFADHFRFQDTKDLGAAAGTWLRCLAYSRAQEQDGLVKASWLRRTFVADYERVEELVAVGLLRLQEDGDYLLHAYAPRNQTRAMLEEDRLAARERMAAARERPRKRTAKKASDDVRRTGAKEAPRDAQRVPPEESQTSPPGAPSQDERAPKSIESSTPSSPFEPSPPKGALGFTSRAAEISVLSNVRPNLDRTSDEHEANKHRTNAFVPTSTSTSINTSSSSSLSPDLHNVKEIQSSHEGGVQRGDGRRPLPPSERALSGPAWLAAFTDGISAVTKRPCTAGRMYLETLERIVGHHAPFRDAPRACEWLKEQSRAFAEKWDGARPAKGLTPDGLERWLNEGRRGPHEFGPKRIVQLPADKWTGDDLSDLGAEMIR